MISWARERERETIGHLITKNKMRNVTWKWWYKPEIYFRFHCFSLSLRFFFWACGNSYMSKSICEIDLLNINFSFVWFPIDSEVEKADHSNNKKTYHKLWNFRFEQKNKKKRSGLRFGSNKQQIHRWDVRERTFTLVRLRHVNCACAKVMKKHAFFYASPDLSRYVCRQYLSWAIISTIFFLCVRANVYRKNDSRHAMLYLTIALMQHRPKKSRLLKLTLQVAFFVFISLRACMCVCIHVWASIYVSFHHCSLWYRA